MSMISIAQAAYAHAQRHHNIGTPTYTCTWCASIGLAEFTNANNSSLLICRSLARLNGAEISGHTQVKLYPASILLIALNPYFEKHELFNPDEKDVLCMDTKSRREKVCHILGVLDATGKYDAHSIFVKCLAEEVCQGEGCHMGVTNTCWL